MRPTRRRTRRSSWISCSGPWGPPSSHQAQPPEKRTAMQIDLHELPEGLSTLDLDLTPDAFGLTAADAELEGPLRVHLTLDRRGDEIWVRGKAQGGAREECSRCLVPYVQ